MGVNDRNLTEVARNDVVLVSFRCLVCFQIVEVSSRLKLVWNVSNSTQPFSSNSVVVVGNR